MNETEKRRRQLLEETRRRYGDSGMTPAVHPRYSGVYSNLYGSEGKDPGSIGSLGIRFLMALLLFAAFIAMDNHNMRIADIDSKRIVTEIEQVAIPYLNDFTTW